VGTTTIDVRSPTFWVVFCGALLLLLALLIFHGKKRCFHRFKKTSTLTDERIQLIPENVR
jgi:bacteriorhodopsin